jgi:predicted kinase
MKKVILTKGLPASGKSTWAKKIIDKHSNNYKRINKDDLRAMLDNSKHSKDAEKFILQTRNYLILLALENGKHVIVDDTNLNPKHEKDIRELVKGKAEVVIQDFTDVAIETCIERDLKRPASVGEAVIRQIWNQYLRPKPEKIEFDPALPNAIICDLDGTLAFLNGRNPYDASNCHDDGLNTTVANILKGRNVILVSAREDRFREPTERFLKKHNIQHLQLLMRASHDSRKDSIIKREIFDTHIRGKYNIEFVLDDRNQVVEMWRQLGLVCLQVAEGDF